MRTDCVRIGAWLDDGANLAAVDGVEERHGEWLWFSKVVEGLCQNGTPSYSSSFLAQHIIYLFEIAIWYSALQRLVLLEVLARAGLLAPAPRSAGRS